MDLKERIKAALDIEAVAREYGITFDKSGRGRCPFPERHKNADADPSLYMDRKSGRIWCNSQGCFNNEKGADIFDLVMIMEGVNFRQARDKLAAQARLSDYGRVQQWVVATYDYRDESARLLFQVVRKEPGKNGRSKDFAIRQPDGKGGWKWTGKGIRLVPYRLSDLQKAAGPVVVAEGEACVDALWEVGIPATSNPFGAGKWRDELNPYLDRREVVLWPDNDKAGFSHVRQVAESLARRGKVASVRVIPPPGELPDKGDVVDGIQEFGWTRERILDILESAQPSPDTDTTSSEDGTNDGDERKRDTLATAIVRQVFADENLELFHDETKTAYALVTVGNHVEVLRCQGRGFRRWLARRVFDLLGSAPGSETISSALNVLEAFANFDGDCHELHNRVAFHDGGIWYDLTNEEWKALRVTATGWEITDPPILFRRYSHQAPQVEPIKGGDLHRLLDFIAVTGDAARLLLLVYVVSCFIPNIPHPILVLHGAQGSGKSSICRVLRRLADPSITETLSFPRDGNELVQKLSHHWFCPFDNVSVLKDWQSDALCRAVTGEGFSKRQLYTDDDDIIYSFRRCLGLNGIGIAATKPDLLDRSILIGLERIPPDKRRTEAELWEAFEEARPHILGGIFDALAQATEMLSEVKLPTMPRMADFARWGCAIAQALGFKSKDFLRAYGENIEVQNEEVLQGHPVAAAVLALMEDRTEWDGAPSELLQKLERVADKEKIGTGAEVWPKAAHILTRRLKEVQTNLQDAGITILFGKSGPRSVTIRRVSENSVQIASAEKPLSGAGLDATDATDATLHTARRKRLHNIT